MVHFVVYSIDQCTYCEKAKQLLTLKNVSFTDIRVNKQDSEYPKMKEWLVSVFKGQKTFPFILKTIGGYSDLESCILETDGV